VARAHKQALTDPFHAVIGSRRGLNAGAELLAEPISEHLRVLVNDAVFALVGGHRESAFALLARSPREAARSPHLAALIHLLASEVVTRVGVDEWMLAEDAATQLDLLPTAPPPLPQLGELTRSREIVAERCEQRLLAALTSGLELSDASASELASAAWREHTLALLAAHAQAGGFPTFQKMLRDTWSRNLARWVRKHHPQITQKDSQLLRVQLLTADAFAPVLEYLAPLDATARSNLSPARDDYLRHILYVGVRRGLGDAIPMPPLPPAWLG
jgi:hypothetical protein